MSIRQDATDDFVSYQRRAMATARAVFDGQPQHATDEQGGPMYLQALAVSRWIFWKRLAITCQLLATRRGTACLDFGCGFGLLLPYLSRRYDAVYAVDLVPRFAKDFLARWAAAYHEEPDNITILSGGEDLALPEHTLDLILALDVLEHVENLPQVVSQMARLLKPDGLLFVSGPTENWLYRLGRWIGQRVAGPEFSGHYHRRNIYDIQDELDRTFAVKIVRRLVYPLTFFVLLSAEQRPQGR
jgi:2-polyprenyl-3-methyl-5-hydroxy-6-metoxy-1,4-benzoquinol methylase